MNEKSNSIQIDMNEKEVVIDPLVESNTPADIDKPVELSPKRIHRFSGILYTLLSSFIFTVSMFIPKQLNVDLFDVSLPRFLFHTIALIIYMKFIKKYSFYKQKTNQELFYLFINGFFTSTGFLAFFFAYRFIPLPDLTTIRYSQVIWVAIITAIIYREKPSISIIVGVLLTMIGIIFVAQPEFVFRKTPIKINKTSTEHIIGSFITLYASIALAIMIISNKYLFIKYKTKPSIILLHYTFTATCMVIIYEFHKYYFIKDRIQAIKNDFYNWRYLFSAIIYLAQILSSSIQQKAIKREHPSIYTICRSSDILFSILLQNIFSSIKSNILSIIGSILVLTSILIISGYKFFTDKNKSIET